MQLYREWANPNRASFITKAAMREMLQIIKADERRAVGVASPLDKPWQSSFIAMQHPSATWTGIELRSGYNVEKKQPSPDSAAWRRFQFQFQKLISGSFLTDEHANSLLSLFSVIVFYLPSTFA